MSKFNFNDYFKKWVAAENKAAREALKNKNKTKVSGGKGIDPNPTIDDIDDGINYVLKNPINISNPRKNAIINNIQQPNPLYSAPYYMSTSAVPKVSTNIPYNGYDEYKVESRNTEKRILTVINDAKATIELTPAAFQKICSQVIQSGFSENYEYSIKSALDCISNIDFQIKRLNNNKYMAPKVILVQIGVDIEDIKIPIKWAGSFYTNKLRRNTFFACSIYDRTFPAPVELFEFPIDNRIDGVAPVTDYVLFPDPYTPAPDALFEEYYRDKGILIMKKFNIEQAKTLLTTRNTIFKNAPTAANTILLFTLMDAVILNDFKSGALEINPDKEKNLIKLEKLKNLALNTKFNEERKNAVDKCMIQYDILMSLAAPVK